MKKAGQATQVGRLIGHLDQIEKWFREGYQLSEVVALLAKAGVEVHKNVLWRTLKRYRLTQGEVLARMARPEVEPLRPTRMTTKRTKPATATKPPKTAEKSGSKNQAENSGGKEGVRAFDFRVDPNPDPDEIVYGKKKG